MSSQGSMDFSFGTPVFSRVLARDAVNLAQQLARNSSQNGKRQGLSFISCLCGPGTLGVFLLTSSLPQLRRSFPRGPFLHADRSSQAAIEHLRLSCQSQVSVSLSLLKLPLSPSGSWTASTLSTRLGPFALNFDTLHTAVASSHCDVATLLKPRKNVYADEGGC